MQNREHEGAIKRSIHMMIKWVILEENQGWGGQKPSWKPLETGKLQEESPMNITTPATPLPHLVNILMWRERAFISSVPKTLTNSLV